MKNAALKLFYWSSFLVFVCLIVIDLTPWKSSGKIGTIIWFLSYIYFLIFSLICLFEIFSNNLKGKALFTSFSLAIILLTVFYNIPQIKNISRENAAEIACTLSHLKNSPDLGFKQSCLFGYPTRQFYLPVIPSLFGKNIISLNLGSSLYLFLGVFILSSGILKYFRHSTFGDLICAIFLASFSHVHFFNHFMFYYEQSIFPFCFGIIIVGLFFHHLNNQDNVPPGFFGICLLYLIYSYTPSLSLYFLSTLILIFLVSKIGSALSKQNRIQYCVIIALSLLSFFMSLKFRTDIRVFNPKERSMGQLIEDLQKSLKHIIFQTEALKIVSPVYNFIFVFIIISPLFFILGWQSFFLSFWIIGVIIMSIISRGYSYYGIDFRLHRATVIFPIVFSLVTILLSKLTPEKKQTHRLLLSIYIVILTTGIYYQNNYLYSKPNDAGLHYLLISSIQKNNTDKLVNKLFFVDESSEDFISLGDTLQYFSPSIFKENIKLKIHFPDCSISQKGMYVIYQNHICYQYFLNNYKIITDFSMYRNKESVKRYYLSQVRNIDKISIFLKQ